MTDRQLEAVKHVANGNSVVETAGIMFVSKSSVNQLLAAAKKAERAKTLAHLVSIAIAKGLLVWTDDNERDVCEDPVAEAERRAVSDADARGDTFGAPEPRRP